MKRKVVLAAAGAAVVALVAGAVVFWPRETTVPVSSSSSSSSSAERTTVETAPDLTFERVTGPGRTVVRDRAGAVVATFTDDARTAVINGAPRSFS